MKSDEIYEVLRQIGANPSKKAKEALLIAYKHEPEFVKVLRYAYDQSLVFGVKEFPIPIVIAVVRNFNHDTWQLLDSLANRDLTGNAALMAIGKEMCHLDPLSQKLLAMILKKDLRAGISESTINKAIPGTIKDFPYMRCSLPKDVDLKKFDWKMGVISQEKADGMFANINFRNKDDISISSRQGSPFPQEPFLPLIEEVKNRLIPGAQYHGELLVKRAGHVLPREQSNGVLNSVLKGGQFADNEHPVYHVWDVIPLKSVVTKGEYKVEYYKRLKMIATMLVKKPGNLISLVPTRIVYSLPAAYEHYEELLGQGKEGTIIKDPHAIWRDGVSRSQCKLKLEVDVDLQVIDFLPGEGKNAATFGSVLCQSSDGLLEVAVSGFTDERRLFIHISRHDLYGSIMTVKANSIMKPSKPGEKHSLFLPRYVEFRDPADKTEADSLQQIIDQFDSAVKGKKVNKKAA